MTPGKLSTSLAGFVFITLLIVRSYLGLFWAEYGKQKEIMSKFKFWPLRQASFFHFAHVLVQVSN